MKPGTLGLDVVTLVTYELVCLDPASTPPPMLRTKPETRRKNLHSPPRRSAGSTRVEGTSISTPRRRLEGKRDFRAFEGCCILPEHFFKAAGIVWAEGAFPEP